MDTTSLHTNFELCYRAVCSRDARFDGLFFTAVTSTGIYCRPICPAQTPQEIHVRFYACAAAAEAAGFRACRRCHPEASPGSPDWNVRADLVARALKGIADGLVDTQGVVGLAQHLGVSERHLHRELIAEIGVGPHALARSRRAQTARMLIDQTNLPLATIAFTAGFTSIRQFNETMLASFGCAPSELRRHIPDSLSSTDSAGKFTLRVHYRPPVDTQFLINFFARRAIPGVEEVVNGRYRRTCILPYSRGIVEIEPQSEKNTIFLHLTITDLRDIPAIVQLSRSCFDLDADSAAVQSVLALDPMLSHLVAHYPGLRIPGTFDGFEMAVRAILGQQISVAGARTIAGRIAAKLGDPLSQVAKNSEDKNQAAIFGTLTRYFPTAQQVAEGDLNGLGITAARIRTIQTLATAVCNGHIALVRSADREELCAKLLAIPGIGPWTASYIAMRALGDPDAFLPTDLGIRKAYEQIYKQTAQPNASIVKDLSERAEAWRPWRAYAMQYLWNSLSLPL